MNHDSRTRRSNQTQWSVNCNPTPVTAEIGLNRGWKILFLKEMNCKLLERQTEGERCFGISIFINLCLKSFEN